jgi:hypothetical protein
VLRGILPARQFISIKAGCKKLHEGSQFITFYKKIGKYAYNINCVGKTDIRHGHFSGRRREPSAVFRRSYLMVWKQKGKPVGTIVPAGLLL